MSASNSTKLCKGCGQPKSLGDFHKSSTHKDRRVSKCKECVKGARKIYYARHVADGREVARRKRNRNERRHGMLRRNYGLSSQEYQEMLFFQGGVCAICGRREKGHKKGGVHKFLAVDHDHKNGMVRGLLCQKCNQGIGCFEESPEFMLKAIAYLNNHTVPYA